MGGSDEAKLFVGGLSQDTTKESLKNHFSQHGPLTDAVVMYDTNSGRSRGFGFVTFEKPDAIDNVLTSAQMVDGKEVDCKRACPREVMAARQYGGSHSQAAHNALKTNKIFVGGLPDLTTDEFKTYFSKYGKVVDAVLMTDKHNNRPRGFGFITYENTEIVDEVVSKFQEHLIKDKWVEVKKAQTKEQLGLGRPGVPGGRGAGFAGYPGAYGAAAYGGYYDGYRGAYPGYDHRRPYAGPVGYDPYAGHPAYAAAAYAGSDAGVRRPYSPYGPSRSGPGGPYRAGGDPYGPMGAAGAGGYGGPGGGGYGAPHPGAGPAYAAAAGYGGGGGASRGAGGNSPYTTMGRGGLNSSSAFESSAYNNGGPQLGGAPPVGRSSYGMQTPQLATHEGYNPYSSLWPTGM